MLIRNDDKQRSRAEDETGDFGSRDVVPGDVRLVVIVPKELGHVLHVKIVARRMAMPYDNRTAHPSGSQCPSRPLSDHRVTAARDPRAIERAIPVSVGTQRSILEASEQGLYESVHFKEPPTSPFQGGNTGSNPVGGAECFSWQRLYLAVRHRQLRGSGRDLGRRTRRKLPGANGRERNSGRSDQTALMSSSLLSAAYRNEERISALTPLKRKRLNYCAARQLFQEPKWKPSVSRSGSDERAQHCGATTRVRLQPSKAAPVCTTG